LEEFGKIVLRNVIIKLLTVVFVFTVVKTKDDLIYYVLCNALANLISAFAMWSYLPKYVKKLPRKGLKPFRNIKVILGLFIPTIAIQIYTVLDKTMIGLITQSANENGYYEQAIKIARMALTIVTALGTVMIPRIGYHFEKGETDTVKDYMYRSYRFVWLLAIPLCLGLIMISDNFVLWFFGDGYEPVIPLMKILALLILAIGINTVTGNQYLIPTKREKAYTFTVVIGAVVNFVLNLILIYYFKAIGAAIASVLAELTIVIVQFVVVRKELSIWNIVKTSGKYLLAGGLMAILLWLENRWLTSSVLNTCIMIVSGATVYFLALLALRDSFLLTNIKKILAKINKKIKEEKKDEEI
jgi:O-antigen/teichoic acid export membrane protein